MLRVRVTDAGSGCGADGADGVDLHCADLH